MKLKIKKKWGLLAGGLAMIAPLVLAACGSDFAGEVGDSTTDRAVVAVADPDNPRWVDARRDIVAELNSYKDADNKSWKVNSNITKNQSEQNSYVESQLAITPKPKVLLVGAIDDTAATLATRAKNEQINFIAYDRLINGTNDYKYYATFDNAKVGMLQGLWLASKITGQNFTNLEALTTWLANTDNANMLKTKANHEIYAIAGGPTDNNAKIFFTGAANVIEMLTKASDGNIRFQNGNYSGTGATTKLNVDTTFNSIAVPNWNYTTAGTRVDSFLSNTTNANKVKAFLAPNDGMAEAVINSLKKANKKPADYFITGQDAIAGALNFILNDEQGMTVAKPDKWMARVIGIWASTLAKSAYVDPTNADNTAAVTTTANAILTAVKADAKIKEFAAAAGLTVDQLVRLDTTSYKPTSTNTAMTYILEPFLVDKSNAAKIKTLLGL